MTVSLDHARRAGLADYVLDRFPGYYTWQDRDCLVVANALLHILTGAPLNPDRLERWHSHKTEPGAIRTALSAYKSLAEGYGDLLLSHPDVRPRESGEKRLPSDLEVVSGTLTAHQTSWDASAPSKHHLGFVDSRLRTRVWGARGFVPLDPGYRTEAAFRASMRAGKQTSASLRLPEDIAEKIVTVGLSDILPGGEAEAQALMEWATNLRDGDFDILDPDSTSHCISRYSIAMVETVLRRATPKVKEILQLPVLHPVSTFVRCYSRGAHLVRHVDRDNLEWTLSIPLLHEGEPWPMNTEFGDTEPMTTGRGTVLKGDTVAHWRNEFEGERSIVALLHWHTDPRCRFDSRSSLNDVCDIAYGRRLGLLESGPDRLAEPGYFTAEECEALIRHAEQGEWANAMPDTDELANYNPAAREALVHKAERIPELQWMWDKLDALAGRFRAPVTSSAMQILKYPEGGGHHTWHTDDEARTVSVSVLLQGSDGRFELERSAGDPVVGTPDPGERDIVTPLSEAGDAVAFLSHMRHRVTPCMSGDRYALAGWYYLEA